jgi:hypothetical protein
MARPTDYRADLAEAICARLAEGMTLSEVCRAGDMPAEAVVRAWVAGDVEGFAARYGRAREAQAEHLADEILEIADDASNDWMARKAAAGGAGGTAVVDREHISRSRLRIDARKWLLAKLAPGKYGEPDSSAAKPVDERELAKSIVAALGRAVGEADVADDAAERDEAFDPNDEE